MTLKLYQELVVFLGLLLRLAWPGLFLTFFLCCGTVLYREDWYVGYYGRDDFLPWAQDVVRTILGFFWSAQFTLPLVALTYAVDLILYTPGALLSRDESKVTVESPWPIAGVVAPFLYVTLIVMNFGFYDDSEHYTLPILWNFIRDVVLWVFLFALVVVFSGLFGIKKVIFDISNRWIWFKSPLGESTIRFDEIEAIESRKGAIVVQYSGTQRVAVRGMDELEAFQLAKQVNGNLRERAELDASDSAAPSA